MSDRAILKALGIGPERAKVLGVRTITLKGVVFAYRPVSPVDFLGAEMHPFMPWGEAKDHISHDVVIAQMQKDALDPAKAAAMQEKIGKAYRGIFLKAVLWPKLSEKPGPDELSPDDLLVDMHVANDLMNAITTASLGGVPGGFLARVARAMSSVTRRLSWTRLLIGMGRSQASLRVSPSEPARTMSTR